MPLEATGESRRAEKNCNTLIGGGKKSNKLDTNIILAFLSGPAPGQALGWL
jgi:hypothetical protein